MDTDWKRKSPIIEGFHKVITRENSDMKYGEFYRINIKQGSKIKFPTGVMEMGLCGITGEVSIDVSGESFLVKKWDSVYAPRNSIVIVSGRAPFNTLYLGAAESEVDITPYQTVYDPNLPIGERRQVHGVGHGRRDVYMCIGPQDKAYRLIMGLTWGGESQWTSWPPHQHSDYLEEIYCYFDMNYPHFGLHLSFKNLDKIICHYVSSGDAVIIPYGYHPTVASPGTSNHYLWIMSARDPADKNRRYDLAKPLVGL